MKKPKTLAKLKKELDKYFSLFIRQKYAVGETLACYTCPHIGTVKTLHCGHFNPRQHLSTRWDERNCRPQCYVCNFHYNGQPAIFANKLVKEYGPKILDEFEQAKWKITKYDHIWYEEEINHYKKLSTQNSKN